MASNCHGVEPIGSVKRWSKAEGTVIDVPQPHLISKYNKNMGGVNRMDQNIGAYRISIRSRKWWLPLFAYLLDVAMQNAWLIYRLMEVMNHQPMDQLEFRRSVCNVYYKKIYTRTHGYRETNWAPEASESACTSGSTHGWQQLH
jgi:DNA excision repair protein ERCC-6